MFRKRRMVSYIMICLFYEILFSCLKKELKLWNYINCLEEFILCIVEWDVLLNGNVLLNVCIVEEEY